MLQIYQEQSAWNSKEAHAQSQSLSQTVEEE